MSGTGQGPPGAQSPFAPSGRYPSRDGDRHLERHYPLIIAHTDSCARPKPSHCFRFPYTASLCRLSPAPAGSWPFPTLSPQSLHRCLDPYPAASLRCSYPFLPEGLRPHLRAQRFGTPQIRHNATSTARRISGLQSFAYVQAPMLARPQVAPTAEALCLQGGQAVYTTQWT